MPHPDAIHVIVGPGPPPPDLVPAAGVVLCHALGADRGVKEAAVAYLDEPEAVPWTVARATGPAGVLVETGVSFGEPDGWSAALGRILAAVDEAVRRGSAWYADALAAALDFDTSPPLPLLTRTLHDAIRALPEGAGPHLRAAAERLSAVAATHAADGFLAACRAYAEPSDLMDDVSLLRLAATASAAADDVAFMRDYLTRAAVPDAMPDLAIDRTLVMEQVSAEVIFARPDRLHALRASFDLFRGHYRTAYAAYHREHHAAIRRLRAAHEAAQPEIEALERLNTLADLGPPDGAEAVQACRRWTDALIPCDEPLLPEDAPRCARCDLPLGAAVPKTAVEDALAGARAALARRLGRLSRRAVRQVLGREEHARVDRLLQAARASDLSALARLLDDEVLSFLAALLRESAPQGDAGVLERLAAAYPEVREDQVQDAVGAFRRLLREALDAQEPGAGPRTVRLRPPDTP